MDGMTLFGLGIIALVIALCVLFNVVGRKNTKLGKVMRWYWNINFRIGSKIPFCGWMAHFIIVVTPADAAMKARALNSGAELDEFWGGRLQAAAQRQKEEYEREQEIRRVMSQNGLETTSVSADGNSAVGTDKDGNTHHVDITWK